VFALAEKRLRNKHDAEDVTQEVFKTAFTTHLDDLTRCCSVEDCKKWLLRVTANKATDFWRRRDSRGRTLRRLFSHLFGHSSNTPHAEIDREIDQESHRVRLSQALLEYASNPRHRTRHEVVVRRKDGESFKDIADAMGMSEGTARSHYARALEDFREKLNPPETRGSDKHEEYKPEEAEPTEPLANA
jgi:RNA polymerase sigma factor (sigma-70 family)